MPIDSRRFIPDPPPADGDPVLMEWLVRQLERIADSLAQIDTKQDGGESAFEDHIENKNDPHETLIPWVVDQVNYDLYPNNAAGDAGIGILDRPVSHITIGTQEAQGMEGYITHRPDADDGGIVIVGLRGIDPNNPPTPPIIPNAQLELAGNIIALMGGNVGVRSDREITADTYVIARPTITLPDGRFVAPLNLGPEVVYQHEETATDATDYDVLDLGEVSVVNPPLTLTNSYSANVSIISVRVFLQNSGRLTLFDVILKIDGIEVERTSRQLESNTVDVSESFTIQTALSPGQVISLDVEATGTHPQSEGWVRGATRATTIYIKQG